MEYSASSEPNIYSPIQGILRNDLRKHLSFGLGAYLMGANMWRWDGMRQSVESQFQQSSNAKFRSTQYKIW
jgi:hypothetical protein